jgi:hypothetical protein
LKGYIELSLAFAGRPKLDISLKWAWGYIYFWDLGVLYERIYQAILLEVDFMGFGAINAIQGDTERILSGTPYFIAAAGLDMNMLRRAR